MNDRTENFYNAKDPGYYAHARSDIAALIRGQGLKVLDVGCGRGATLAGLKRSGQAALAVGIEINPEAAREAQARLDRVIVGNIESLELDYPEGHFDLIMMADVLEHLVDPWGTLNRLKRYLAPRGMVIVSLPNLREFHTLNRLVFSGDFRYDQAGIMDRTHLRFFCKKNMLDLFRKGFEIKEIRTVPELKKGEMALFNRLTLRLFEEFLVIQYIIAAQNTGLSSPAPKGGRDG